MDLKFNSRFDNNAPAKFQINMSTYFKHLFSRARVCGRSSDKTSYRRLKRAGEFQRNPCVESFIELTISAIETKFIWQDISS